MADADLDLGSGGTPLAFFGVANSYTQSPNLKIAPSELAVHIILFKRLNIFYINVKL